MSQDKLQEICSFIENAMGRYKKPFTKETQLERDLGITGDDAVELLIAYSEKYKVDLTNFNINAYFHPEGDSILPAINRLLTGKKNPKSKELTLGDLEKGIEAGRLDDDIINGA